jgi:pimeloyl-ACP methyl ester carboxylesterase
MSIVKQILSGAQGLSEVPELTSAAVEAARVHAAVGCLIDRVYRGHPLIISFAFRESSFLQRFDFFGRCKKLEKNFNVHFNRILLRDVFNSWYHRGVPGLGHDVEAVTVSLRALIDAIQPSKVIAIGQSMGGYAAIMYGMLLGADRIVAFGPLSHLNPDEAIRFGDNDFLPVMQSLQVDRPRSVCTDLVRLGREVDYQGGLYIIFGTHLEHNDGMSCTFDAIHALRLAQLPNTFLEPYPESDHPVVQWLVDNEKMDDLLARLLIADFFP